MHLKSKGALMARTLSYAACEFAAVSNVGSDELEKTYNKSSELWGKMYVALKIELKNRKERQKFKKDFEKATKIGGFLDPEMAKMRDMYADSDDESEDELTEAEKEASAYRKKCRDRPPFVVNSVFWGAHQRFFRSLCIANKVDLCIESVKKSLEDGHCCVIGLQSTGEARAKDAAKQASNSDSDSDDLHLDNFISAAEEGMLRILMNLFPLPVSAHVNFLFMILHNGCCVCFILLNGLPTVVVYLFRFSLIHSQSQKECARPIFSNPNVPTKNHRKVRMLPRKSEHLL
jgi:hypothetical protein